MTFEDLLRRTLTDERHTLPTWPDPVARVRAGIVRRRRRRAATMVAVAALIAVAIGVPGTLRAGWRDHPPTDPALAQPIPWLDVPAPAPTHLARREPRPATRACTPADLGVHPAGRPPLAWVEQDRAGDGYERHTVLLPNRMGSRCTLRGSAELVATDAASGQRVQLTRRFDPPTVDDVHQYPATIDAGEPARIDLTVTSRCADPAATAPPLP